MCMCTRMYACVCVHKYSMCVWICSCVHICTVCMHVYVCVYVCVCVCVVFVCVCVCVCVLCVCVYACLWTGKELAITLHGIIVDELPTEGIAPEIMH